MQKKHIPISGEGASLSRRNFITIAAAGTAATLPAVALAEASGKSSRLPQPPELPIERFDRHAAELSGVLNEYLEGQFYACIYPSEDYDYPVVLKSIAAEKRATSLEAQLDECVSRLRDILARMHPDISVMHKPHLSSRPDGSFRFTVQGDVAFQPFQGDGIYLVSIDGYPCEYLVREQPVVTLKGRWLGYSHYYGRARADDGGWDDYERHISENFVRKIGEVPA